MKEDQDEKYDKIENKLKKMVQNLSGFIQIADVQFPYVEKLAKRADHQAQLSRKALQAIVV